MRRNNIIRPLVVTLAFLLIAVFGNRFVNGWNWSLFDFIIVAVLIFGTGILIELANKKIKNKNKKVAVIAVVILSLLVLWAHLAVGIVDTWPLAGS